MPEVLSVSTDYRDLRDFVGSRSGWRISRDMLARRTVETPVGPFRIMLWVVPGNPTGMRWSAAVTGVTGPAIQWSGLGRELAIAEVTNAERSLKMLERLAGVRTWDQARAAMESLRPSHVDFLVEALGIDAHQWAKRLEHAIILEVVGPL